MLAEQQRRSLSDDVQYLTDRQLEQLVEQTPDNDIKDYEDLQSGEWGAGGRAQRPRWTPTGTGVSTNGWQSTSGVCDSGATKKIVRSRQVCQTGTHERWRSTAGGSPAGRVGLARGQDLRDWAADPAKGPCVLGALVAFLGRTCGLGPSG